MLSVDHVGQNSMIESFQEEPSVDGKIEDKDETYEDSESENEDGEDSRHRGRFRTERPSARLPSSQPKADIPDTLGKIFVWSSSFMFSSMVALLGGKLVFFMHCTNNMVILSVVHDFCISLLAAFPLKSLLNIWSVSFKIY